MDKAMLLFIVKYAIFVRTRPDGKPAALFVAILCEKRRGFHPKEVGNPLYFIHLDKDAPFPVATSSTHLAFIRLHDKCLK
jgi:hypothetical protein